MKRSGANQQLVFAIVLFAVAILIIQTYDQVSYSPVLGKNRLGGNQLEQQPVIGGSIDNGDLGGGQCPFSSITPIEGVGDSGEFVLWSIDYGPEVQESVRERDRIRCYQSEGDDPGNFREMSRWKSYARNAAVVDCQVKRSQIINSYSGWLCPKDCPAKYNGIGSECVPKSYVIRVVEFRETGLTPNINTEGACIVSVEASAEGTHRLTCGPRAQ